MEPGETEESRQAATTAAQAAPHKRGSNSHQAAPDGGSVA